MKGDETKEDAQVRLIEEMISRGGMRPGAKVLDVGTCTTSTSTRHQR